MSDERGIVCSNIVAVGADTSSCLPHNPQARFRRGRFDIYNPSHHGSQHKLQQHSSSKPGFPRTSRHQRKWVTGGPGMQAVFLDSGKNNKSNGTGVFLPQIRLDNSQPHPIKKPACSPVLLPSRVVQALNLNVNDLGLKITSRKELNEIGTRKKKVIEQKPEELIWEPSHVYSEKECLFPDIFLPKEWTY